MASIEIDNATIVYADDDFVEPWRPHGAVVLQHGFARSGRLWAPWVPYLGRDFRVLRPDLRGCGGSSPPEPGYKYSLDGLVADFIAILDSLDIESVHFAGEAFGSVLAAATAAAEPSRVRSLTLMNTPTSLSRTIVDDIQSAGYPSWEEAVQALGLKDWYLRTHGTKGNLTGDSRIDDYIAAEHGRTTPAAAVGLIPLFKEFDLETILPSVRVPTRLLISNKYSMVTSATQQEDLARLVPGATVQLCDSKYKSFMCYLDAGAVAPAALRFMQEVDSEQD